MDGNDDEYLPDWDFQSIYGREALAARRQVMPRRRERRGSRVPRHVCALWHGAVTRFHDCGFLLSPICGITSPTGFSHIPPNLVVGRCRRTLRASRREDLQVEHPVRCRDASTFDFYPTQPCVLGAPLGSVSKVEMDWDYCHTGPHLYSLS